MTTTTHPVIRNDFSITIVSNDNSDSDDVLLLYSENEVHVFRGMATQYEAGVIYFIGSFKKGTELINKFVNGNINTSDFLNGIEELNK